VGSGGRSQALHQGWGSGGPALWGASSPASIKRRGSSATCRTHSRGGGERWFCACLGCMVTLTQQKYNPIADANCIQVENTYVCCIWHKHSPKPKQHRCQLCVCVLQSSRMRAEQHKLVRSLVATHSRGGVGAGYSVCACLGCMVTLTQQKYNPSSLKWRTRVLYLAQALAQT
jgi:hypothetical protein